MRDVQRQLGDQAPAVEWKPFSLRQQNFPDQALPRIWDRDGDDKIGRSQRGFRLCALAFQQRGDKGVGDMYRALGAARHERSLDIDDEDVLVACAAEVGIVEAEARAAFRDRSLDAWLDAGHTEAKDRYNVFGVPTLTFDGEHPIFAAMRPAPASDEAVDVLRQVIKFARDQAWFRELKRPAPVAPPP